MRLFLFGLLLAVLPQALLAQFQVGWRSDSYAGINSALLNPALPARTPCGWDLNFGEATAFFASNYAYLGNTNLRQLFQQRDNELTFVQERDLPADANVPAGTITYDFFDRDRYFAQTLATVMGPSFSVRVAPMTRIGVFTRAQTMLSITDIDDNLGYDRWQTILDEQVFGLERLRLAGAAWTEVGLNFSQGINTASGELSFGLSVRRLWGERGAYLASNKDFQLSKLPAYIGLSGGEFEIEGAFSNNLIDDTNSSSPTGTGWGLDLGFLYQVDLGEDFFRWEFGGAILNLGAINFTDAQQHRYTTEQLAASLTADYENFEPEQGVGVFAEQFSQDVFSDPAASLQAENFKLGLPTTASFQATYRLNHWAKVDANVLAGISPFGPRLVHSSVVAVTPRVERHWWSIGMPVSLYAGQQARLGLAARLGPLFVGTDQLGSFVGKGRVTGGDFYFGVKLHPLGLNRSGSKKGKKRGRRGKGKDVECYKF